MTFTPFRPSFLWRRKFQKIILLKATFSAFPRPLAAVGDLTSFDPFDVGFDQGLDTDRVKSSLCLWWRSEIDIPGSMPWICGLHSPLNSKLKRIRFRSLYPNQSRKGGEKQDETERQEFDCFSLRKAIRVRLKIFCLLKFCCFRQCFSKCPRGREERSTWEFTYPVPLYLLLEEEAEREKLVGIFIPNPTLPCHLRFKISIKKTFKACHLYFDILEP